MKLIDVHSHLQDSEFNEDREKVIEDAKSNSVSKIIVSTLDLQDACGTLEMFKAHKSVHITIGCNPCILDENEVEKIQELARNKRKEIVGIGEVGLDYYYIQGKQSKKQIKIFKSWISIAKEMDVPLVVHSRSAGKYAIEILLEERYHNVLMHAYDGKVGWALKGAENGFYFSIPPSVVHSIQKQKIARALNLDNLMLESDSPVLGPWRGKRNEPSNLIYTLKKLSEIKRIPEEEIARITSQNAVNLFKIN
ncbi:TatD family hydrolase [candidate division WOR-3 bacterium]|nr:TatD family hydrolase [candidate division WOR-3 bacterium]